MLLVSVATCGRALELLLLRGDLFRDAIVALEGADPEAEALACIDGWNPSLSYTDFAVRYKVFEQSLKKTSEL